MTGASTFSQLRPYKPEKLNSVELGLKGALADHRLRLDAAAFYYDYRDKQQQGFVLDPVFGLLFDLVNVPKSRVEGVEVSLRWLPVATLELNAGATYIDSKITEFVGLDPAASTAAGTQVYKNYAGDQLNDSPKISASGGAYTCRLNERLNLRFAANVNYKGRSNGITDPPAYTNARGLLDAQVGLLSTDERWSVQLWGRNLTDKFYWNGAFRSVDQYVRAVGMPRTFGVSAIYQWR